MTTTQRNRVRRLQDRIVAEGERRGFDDRLAISVDLPGEITLHALRSALYPCYEGELSLVLSEWRGRSSH